jgi:hypothetical protein
VDFEKLVGGMVMPHLFRWFSNHAQILMRVCRVLTHPVLKTTTKAMHGKRRLWARYWKNRQLFLLRMMEMRKILCQGNKNVDQENLPYFGLRLLHYPRAYILAYTDPSSRI